MRHMSRSIMSGLLCAAMAFAFLVGCDNPSDNDAPVSKKRGDSGGVTEGNQTWAGTKTFVGNYGMVGTNATAVVIHSCANTGPATALFLGTPQLGGPRIRQLDQTVTTSGLSSPMASQIPKGAVILSVQAEAIDLLTASGSSVTWSLGLTGGTVNTYGTAGYPTAADSLVSGSSSWWVGPGTALSNAASMSVFAAATGGGSAGNGPFVGSGRIRIVVTYMDCGSLFATEQ